MGTDSTPTRSTPHSHRIRGHRHGARRSDGYRQQPSHKPNFPPDGIRGYDSTLSQKHSHQRLPTPNNNNPTPPQRPEGHRAQRGGHGTWVPRDRNPHHRSRRTTLRHSRTRSERITTDPYREREPRSGVTGEGSGNQNLNFSPGRTGYRAGRGQRARTRSRTGHRDRGQGWEPLADREPQTHQATPASESRTHRGGPHAGRAGQNPNFPPGAPRAGRTGTQNRVSFIGDPRS